MSEWTFPPITDGKDTNFNPELNKHFIVFLIFFLKVNLCQIIQWTSPITLVCFPLAAANIHTISKHTSLLVTYF